MKVNVPVTVNCKLDNQKVTRDHWPIEELIVPKFLWPMKQENYISTPRITTRNARNILYWRTKISKIVEYVVASFKGNNSFFLLTFSYQCIQLIIILINITSAATYCFSKQVTSQTMFLLTSQMTKKQWIAMLFHPIISVKSSMVTRKFCISTALVSNDDHKPC